MKDYRDASGQVLVLAAVSMVGLLALTAFAIDVGHLLNAQRQLQASSDAAATAGAQILPDVGGAISTAMTYSGLPGRKNARPDLPGVLMAPGYPLVKCLSSTGIACMPPGNSNAIAVRQTTNVTMYFARVLGISSIPITATATASAAGGGFPPLDVTVILDTTQSMNSSGCAGGGSRINCAVQGLQAFLLALWPCPSSLGPCGPATGGNVAIPVDEVGLFVFPGVTAATVPNDYDCSSGTHPVTVQYTTPPGPGVHQIVALSSDYRASATASSLNTTSNLVRAARGGGCSGLEVVGGQGSQASTALRQAQAALVAQPASRLTAQNVIILLSDGDYNQSDGTGGTSCQQAVAAASAAKSAGTWIYAIQYGASGSCGGGMQQIASGPALPYYQFQPTNADLTTTFRRIADDLTSTRLLSDNTP